MKMGAMIVIVMKHSSSSPVTLPAVELGDLVRLPDGNVLSIRGKVVLPSPVRAMSGFVVAGELGVLLSLPTSPADPAIIMVPTPGLSTPPERWKVISEGAFRYWSPQLPSVAGAMGELQFRVITHGTIDPVIFIYKYPETIIFVRSDSVHIRDIAVSPMARNVANEISVTRVAARVEAPVAQPVYAPRPRVSG